MYMIKNCFTCNKEFTKSATKSLKEWNRVVKYCSKKCSQTLFKKGHGKDELNVNWKGDKAGYGSKHDWIKSRLGKATYCSFDRNHVSKRFEWANISGAYLRELDDWVQLCVTCHRQYDMIRSGYMAFGKSATGR